MKVGRSNRLGGANELHRFCRCFFIYVLFIIMYCLFRIINANYWFMYEKITTAAIKNHLWIINCHTWNNGRLVIILLIFIVFLDIFNKRVSERWAFSSAGRAPPWHGGGHRFDPGKVHQIEIYSMVIEFQTV